MAHLLPCPGCARHVRAAEPSCPFCGSALEAREVQVVEAPARFTGRAQILGFRASVGAVAVAAAIGTSACGAAAPLYGAPPADAGMQDGGGPGPLYGGPPDAGEQTSDSGTVEDDAGTDAGPVAPAYGAPPDDAGTQADSGGGAIPLYGGPPAD